MSIIYSLIKFIMANYTVSFEAYVEVGEVFENRERNIYLIYILGCSVNLSTLCGTCKDDAFPQFS